MGKATPLTDTQKWHPPIVPNTWNYEIVVLLAADLP
jgi:hypothetical protein